MYCRNCGKEIDDLAVVCVNCGYSTTFAKQKSNPDDKPSKLFAVLGFFLPIVGLVLYLVYNDKEPKKAKSAGKGAIAGVITGIVIAIIVSILIAIIVPIFIVKVAPSMDEIHNTVESFEQVIDDFEDNVEYEIETIIEEDYEEGVSVDFGEFIMQENQIYSTTGLEVIVTNASYNVESYYITIFACDENEEIFDSDTVLAEDVPPNGNVIVSAFTNVPVEEFEKYKNAEYRIVEIDEIDNYQDYDYDFDYYN